MTDCTLKTWHDGVYYTGDMAWRDKDGYHWFVGRADDVIKSSVRTSDAGRLIGRFNRFDFLNLSYGDPPHMSGGSQSHEFYVP